MVIQNLEHFSLGVPQLDTTGLPGTYKVAYGFWKVSKVYQNLLPFYTRMYNLSCFFVIKPFLLKLLNIALLGSDNLGGMFLPLLTS